MRVSEYYKLKKSQASLRFVDVDVRNDIKLFINAKAIRSLGTEWAAECEEHLSTFFEETIGAIRAGRDQHALKLLEQLREPNETHLGLSTGASKGRGLGPDKAREIWKSLTSSKSVRSGLISDIEDTALLIDGVSVDIISDIITNIIRGPLIGYTQEVCKELDIELSQEVDSGPIWDSDKREWRSIYVELPTPNNEKILFVPKSIVRLTGDYDIDTYYRDFIIEDLKDQEKDSNSSLVSVIKTGINKGTKKVTKKSIEEKYGSKKKELAIARTEQHPDLFAKFKEKSAEPTGALSHRQIADAQGTAPPNWDKLLSDVLEIPAGKKRAYDFEDAIENLMTAVFYPFLVEPSVQTPIHDGLKRVDITFRNYAQDGFFRWISLHKPSPYIFLECKNYGGELGNPEIDQIAMRFSPERGRFGIIFCRSVEDRDKMNRRCRAVSNDNHGYVVVIDDEDLKELVSEVKNPLNGGKFTIIKQRFDRLLL